MNRRDSERNHSYAKEVFYSLGISDLQGVLKEGGVFQCGLEAYQVNCFDEISFDFLNQKAEYARFNFCRQLGIPFYNVIVSALSRRYRIYLTKATKSGISHGQIAEYSEVQFVNWWRSQQSFTQIKAMYEAKQRINNMVDNLLFSSMLSWGINVDGFSHDPETGRINAIYEKRICTVKPDYTVQNYDPNRYFHGTANRAGDFSSWSLLYEISARLGAALILLTFDTSPDRINGAARIINVDRGNGLSYKNDIRPCENIFRNDIAGLREWICNNTG